MTKSKRNKLDNFLLPNAPTFIVVGNSSEARIYRTTSRFGEWTDVASLTNPGAGLRNRDTATDRPGRVFDSFGMGRHSLAPEETGRQQETHRFAHDLGNFLNRAMTAGEFDNLVLIADPTFLGYLRQELTPATSRSISCEVPMNATSYDMQRLRSLFVES